MHKIDSVTCTISRFAKNKLIVNRFKIKLIHGLLFKIRGAAKICQYEIHVRRSKAQDVIRNDIDIEQQWRRTQYSKFVHKVEQNNAHKQVCKYTLNQDYLSKIGRVSTQLLYFLCVSAVNQRKYDLVAVYQC